MRESQLAAKIAAILLASSCRSLDDGIYMHQTRNEIALAAEDAYDILYACRLEGARRYKAQSTARTRRKDEARVNDR